MYIACCRIFITPLTISQGVLLKMAGLTREALLLAAEYKDMLNDQTNGEEYLYLATQRVEELQCEMEKLVTKLPMGSIHPVNATRQSAIFLMRPDVMSAGVGDIILELNYFWNAYTAKAIFLSDDVLEVPHLNPDFWSICNLLAYSPSDSFNFLLLLSFACRNRNWHDAVTRDSVWLH